MPVVKDTEGRFMVTEPAGGTGGGATSGASRLATMEEITAFHAEAVEVAQAALDAAKEANKAHVASLPKEEPPPTASRSSSVSGGASTVAGSSAKP
jgi:hypothetical protein